MTKPAVPAHFHFRFALQCQYRDSFSAEPGHLVDLPPTCALPFPGEMNGETPFAEIRMAWNESGLAIQWEVPGKRERLYGDSRKLTNSDGMSLWVDPRATVGIHRANRYCQRFLILAHNGTDPPAAEIRREPIRRALEEPAAVDMAHCEIRLWGLDRQGKATEPTSTKEVRSYRLEAILARECLVGFEPEAASRLSFFYRVRDHELGDQLLAAAREFPYWEDPSLWQTLVLAKEKAASPPPRKPKRSKRPS